MQPILMRVALGEELIAGMMEREWELFDALGLGRGVSIFKARRDCTNDISDER